MNELKAKVISEKLERTCKEDSILAVRERWKYNTYNVEDREKDAQTIFEATKHILFNLKNEYINQSLANFYESLLTFKYDTFYKERKNDWSKKYNFTKSILYFSSELKGGCGKTFLANAIMDYFIDLGVANESDKKLKLYSDFNFKRMGFNSRTLSTSAFVLYDDEDETFINNKKFKSIRKSIAEKEYVSYSGKDYKKYDDGKIMKVNANVIVTGNEIQNSFINANSRDIHEVKFSTDKYKTISKNEDFIHYGKSENECLKITKQSLETIFELLTPETLKTILKKLSISETNDTTEHIINLYTKIFNTANNMISSKRKDFDDLHPIYYKYFIEAINIFKENSNLSFNDHYHKFCATLVDRDASSVYESGKVYFSKVEYRDAILEMEKLGFVKIEGAKSNGEIYSVKSKNFLNNKLKFNINKFINDEDIVLEYDVEKNLREYYKLETGIEKKVVYENDEMKIILVPLDKKKQDLNDIKGATTLNNKNIDEFDKNQLKDKITNDINNIEIDSVNELEDYISEKLYNLYSKIKNPKTWQEIVKYCCKNINEDFIKKEILENILDESYICNPFDINKII